MRHMYDPSFQLLMDKEGGITLAPKDDPGGMTAFGVARNRWPDWEGWKIVDDLIITGLPTKERAYEKLEKPLRKFYRDNFWNEIQADKLPAGIDMFLFLASVNQGTHVAAKTLQWAVGATQDGIIGPNTLAAVKASNALVVLDKCLRRSLYGYMQVSDPANRKTNGMGWINRVFDVYQIAQEEV